MEIDRFMREMVTLGGLVWAESAPLTWTPRCNILLPVSLWKANGWETFQMAPRIGLIPYLFRDCGIEYYLRIHESLG